MVNKQIFEKLTQLNLSAMAESYQLLSENPENSSLPVDELLGMIVDAEWTARSNKRLQRLLKESSMISGCCIEDIDYQPARNINRQMIAFFSECIWIANRRNMIITGKTGTGKSYLACALGNMACRLNYSVKYFRLPRLIADLNIAKLNGSYNRYLNQLKKCQLLILDDWGLAEITADSRDILEMINYRLHTGSTLLASRIPLQEWDALFDAPTLADDCFDSLLYNAYRIELGGDSMRKVMAKTNATQIDFN
ncbi:IS21 family transposase ISAfe12 [Sporomusa rhizae]|uniref:IS21-like element helper ATPase IstB n=1 Tax=Sporomusa rhizae TaxID=357999 RepID=UPI00352ADF38